MTRASKDIGAVKAAWLFLSSIVVGTTVWTTHFIALLAYLKGGPVAYDGALTLTSLLAAVCGSGASLALATWRPRRGLILLGGVCLGLTVATMHYLGMLAYQTSGTVTWSGAFVLASIVCAAVLGAFTLGALRGGAATRRRLAGSAALLAATILSVHFTGMSALDIVPVGAEAAGHGPAALAVAVTLAAALIITIGAFNYLIDQRTRREADRQIAAMAQTDALTGLPNHIALEEEIARRCASTSRHEYFAVILFQLANLSAIEQKFGAVIADRTLQAMAVRLAHARKPGVLLARTGDAQFGGAGAVSGRDDTLFRAQRVRSAVNQDLLMSGCDIQLDVRVGAATFRLDSDDPNSLLRQAQAALKRALGDPLEPIALHDEALDAEARRRYLLTDDLRGALERNELEMFYQPQVWIEDRRVIGFEALLRWRHPQYGMVSPAEFIPLAEKTGLILPIGEWALHVACREAASWPDHCRVAVNLSPLQLRDPHLPQKVEEALTRSGLKPERLEIELTESLLIADRQRASQIFKEIKALNVRVVLDDFGVGFSSMDVLRQFPFDKVKLDRTFIAEVETSHQARAILKAMLALGKELSMPILVEGVESERQLAILRGHGCNKVQGYLTGRPMPAGALVWVHSQQMSA